MAGADWRRLIVLFLFTPGLAAAADPLPEPLTLRSALELADRDHPEVATALADLDVARADSMAAHSAGDLDVRARARARYIKESDADDGLVDDHAVGVSITKRLYDFGYTRNRAGAADAEQAGRQWFYREAWHDHLLAIMRDYLDVVLADLAFVSDNEAMSMAYIRMDRSRERLALGKTDEVRVAELERIYQKSRRVRNASQSRQRTSRARLAASLNRPAQLSSELEMPTLPQAWDLPPVEELQARALSGNPGLKGLREQLEAARLRVEAERGSNRPVFEAEVGASASTRKLRSRDDVRAGIVMEMPLYTGRRRTAAIARERAQLRGLQAQLRQGEMEVRQAVLEIVMEMAELQLQGREMESLELLRDLELERNRALYEMEVATDFGDAMARQSRARLLSAETGFRLFMARARLAALLGEDPLTLLEVR